MLFQKHEFFLVAKEGVEPSWVSPRDFESRASAIPPLGHFGD